MLHLEEHSSPHPQAIFIYCDVGLSTCMFLSSLYLSSLFWFVFFIFSPLMLWTSHNSVAQKWENIGLSIFKKPNKAKNRENMVCSEYAGLGLNGFAYLTALSELLILQPYHNQIEKDWQKSMSWSPEIKLNTQLHKLGCLSQIRESWYKILSKILRSLSTCLAWMTVSFFFSFIHAINDLFKSN